MDKEERRKLLANHLAHHITNSHRGYDFPSNDELADYIYCGMKDYEYRHKDQEILIIHS